MQHIDRALNLPQVLSESTLPHLNQLTKVFGLQRDVLPSDLEINEAWARMPRVLSTIPTEVRTELIFKMCLATSIGLFDGAINYIWNAVIIQLKNQLKNFGFANLATVLGKDFEESDLNEMTDASLLDICYKVEILSEEGYFFLNQCRDIRNNFSIAHPSLARIDDMELVNFINRCCKYGLNVNQELKNININEFIFAVKDSRLSSDTIQTWKHNLENTFSAQRQLLIPMLYGLYCDPKSNESTRINALQICESIKEVFDQKTLSKLLEQHTRYFAKNEVEKYRTSGHFFERLGMLNLLSSHEIHSVIKRACDNLMQAHLGYDNFYNEPPFADRLLELTNATELPNITKSDLVNSIVTCYVGNAYGVSRAAIPYYGEIIINFSPQEIEHLLNVLDHKSILSERIKNYPNCRSRYKQALELIHIDSIPAKLRSLYIKYTS